MNVYLQMTDSSCPTVAMNARMSGIPRLHLLIISDGLRCRLAKFKLGIHFLDLGSLFLTKQAMKFGTAVKGPPR